jgi:hypothetical protein
MIDLRKLRKCPKCGSGRTWIQPPTSTDIVHPGTATLFHCCGDGKKLTVRIMQRSEAAAVAKWNGGDFDWVDWSLGRVSRQSQ